jgi:hypothetical protein
MSGELRVVAGEANLATDTLSKGGAGLGGDQRIQRLRLGRLAVDGGDAEGAVIGPSSGSRFCTGG